MITPTWVLFVLVAWAATVLIRTVLARSDTQPRFPLLYLWVDRLATVAVWGVAAVEAAWTVR